jgi:hypothetical protein
MKTQLVVGPNLGLTTSSMSFASTLEKWLAEG